MSKCDSTEVTVILVVWWAVKDDFKPKKKN